MIDYAVTADSTGVSNYLKALNQDLVPKATAKGINETALQAQEAVRSRMTTEFTLRRKEWAKRSIKMVRFAKVGSLAAVLRVQPPGNADRSGILTQHEGGGEKKPRDGSRLAVPDQSLTRGGKRVLPARQRPKAFDLIAWGKSSRAEVSRGKDGTFMIKKPGGTGGIYQRVAAQRHRRKKDREAAAAEKAQGRQRDAQGRFLPGQYAERRRRMATDMETRETRDMNIRTLYRFTPSATLESRLHFIDTAMGVVQARFATNLSEAFDRAVQAGRSGKGGNRTAKSDVEGQDRGRDRGRMPT